MEEKEINIFDLLRLFAKRWWIILLVSVICGSALGVYSWFSYTPSYTSEVTVYVDAGKQSESITENMYEVNWALKVIKNYMEILKTEDFLQEISTKYEQDFPESWSRQNYTSKMLANCMNFSATDETYLFTVSITTSDAHASYNIGKLFEELAPDKIKAVTGIESINIADTAKLASTPSNSRNVARNAVIGFFVGAVLAFLIVFVVDMIDVRIKNEEDVAKSYNYPLLGSIPNYDYVTRKKNGGYGYGKK